MTTHFFFLERNKSSLSPFADVEKRLAKSRKTQPRANKILGPATVSKKETWIVSETGFLRIETLVDPNPGPESGPARGLQSSPKSILISLYS